MPDSVPGWRSKIAWQLVMAQLGSGTWLVSTSKPAIRSSIGIMPPKTWRKQLAAFTAKKLPNIVAQRTYFKNNLKRMNYLEMRIEEYPIGSGMVESDAKQYKGRFCGAGMWWSRPGAERLIPIRSAILSKRFDKMWHLAYNSPPN
jgi:hypothetical protein